MEFENDFVALYFFYCLQPQPSAEWLRDRIGTDVYADPDARQARHATNCIVSHSSEILKASSDLTAASRGHVCPTAGLSALRLLGLWWGLARAVALNRVAAGLEPDAAAQRFARVCVLGQTMIHTYRWGDALRTGEDIHARIAVLFDAV